MAGKRIVIIDDDPDIRDALTMILDRAGYQLTCCVTGSEGLRAVRANPPDLILLDIMLVSPSEGLHVARELRRDEALGRIPIIMITSYRGALGMDYAKEFGSDYVPPEMVLDKPLTAETVLQAVRGTLAKSSAPDEP